MFHRVLQQFMLPAAVAVGVSLSAPAMANLTKEDVNQLIHDYILKNPQIILDSVNQFQKKSLAEQQAASLERNHDELFNNEKSPFLGNPKGDITIVEFFDYNCHYCKEVFFTLRDLANEDKNLRVVFKDYPILGATSELAAKWALAAQQQGKYFEFHQKLMEHKGPLKNEDIQSAASAIGLDIDKARLFVDGPESLLQIERNRILAGQMDFRGTPSFVVDNEAFSGVPSKDELKAKIAEKRNKAKDSRKQEENNEKKAE